MIGVGRKTAPDADKLGLTAPVRLVDATALGARTRRVARIHGYLLMILGNRGKGKTLRFEFSTEHFRFHENGMEGPFRTGSYRHFIAARLQPGECRASEAVGIEHFTLKDMLTMEAMVQRYCELTHRKQA